MQIRNQPQEQIDDYRQMMNQQQQEMDNNNQQILNGEPQTGYGSPGGEDVGNDQIADDLLNLKR